MIALPAVALAEALEDLRLAREAGMNKEDGQERVGKRAPGAGRVLNGLGLMLKRNNARKNVNDSNCKIR